MAQDLNLAGEIINPDEPEVGQFWRDNVNGDVLRILEIDELGFEPNMAARYARCICYPRGEYAMGIQEMKVSHFQTERFSRIGRWKSFWYKIKFRKARPLA